MKDKKTIVVSAVNLNTGGTLTILRNCLEYLSTLANTGNYRIVAIVFDKNLALYPGIEYIETQWPKKRWTNRLWYEYVTMKKISKQLSPIYLWFSLHDVTPNIVAEKRAVYCHCAFPFYRFTYKEVMFAPKIMMFALMLKYVYKFNIKKNNHIVVQQEWFKEGISNMFNLNKQDIIVAPPKVSNIAIDKQGSSNAPYTFLFASSPDSHKNFELIGEACKLVEEQVGVNRFRVVLTMRGDENKYAKWIYGKYGDIKSIDFAGFMTRDKLYENYSLADCLVFPSKVETCGLPIAEFAQTNKSMLLADLPYAHETASGCKQAAFFNPHNAKELASQMEKLIKGEDDFLQAVPEVKFTGDTAQSWEELFKLLLAE